MTVPSFSQGRAARLFLLGLLLTTIVSYLLHSEAAHLKLAAGKYHGERIIIGADLFNQHCATCHGTRGEGIGHLGPGLNDKHFFVERLQEVGWLEDLPDYIAATTAHGRMMATRPLYAGNTATAVMVPWAQRYGGPLTEAEIETITDFIMNWEQTALGTVTLPTIVLPPPDLSSPSMINRGRQVFVANCQRCHDFGQLTGDNIGPSLTGIGTRGAKRLPDTSATDYLRESVTIPDAYIVDGFDEQAQSQGCGAIVSEGQLQAVTGYLLHGAN